MEQLIQFLDGQEKSRLFSYERAFAKSGYHRLEKRMFFLWLMAIGFIIGALGTLIGVGGGFIMVPMLLWLYPQEKTEVVTGISLAVIFVNALSGSVAYARMKRIDYRAGGWFAVATIPGAILGALTVSYVPRCLFDTLFGFALIAGGIFLFARRHATLSRELPEDSQVPKLQYNLRVGVGISVLVGYISSMLGIGGGIVHVPALVHLLNFPVHIATATSHFVLMIMALAGTLVHAWHGVLTEHIRPILGISAGALVGAQVGARLSNHLRGTVILRALALALIFVGCRLFIKAFP